MTEYRIGEFSGAMAHAAILSSGQVINQLTNGDHVVMARFAGSNDDSMIKGTTGKGANAMANTAIIVSRHVIDGFTSRFPGNTGVAS